MCVFVCVCTGRFTNQEKLGNKALSYSDLVGVWSLGMDFNSVYERVRTVVAGMADVCLLNHVHLFIHIPRPLFTGPG